MTDCQVFPPRRSPVTVDRLPGVPSQEESIKKVTVDRLRGVPSQEESIKKVTVGRWPGMSQKDPVKDNSWQMARRFQEESVKSVPV